MELVILPKGSGVWALELWNAATAESVVLALEEDIRVLTDKAESIYELSDGKIAFDG